MINNAPALQSTTPTQPETTPAPEAPQRSDFGSSAIRIMVAASLVFVIAMSVRQALNRRLSIDSQPTGASVFINGRLVGKAPIQVSGLSGGAYSVRFEKEDFASLSVPVVLGWGTTRLNETLPARGAGTLKIAVEPVGAEVVLDGELIGHTPLELSGVASGSHELLIRKTNFKAYSQRIALEAGQTQEFKDFALEDLVLTMLQNGVDKDPQRVANYMDMGHYLFANNKIKEAGDFYVAGLKVAGTPLTFAKEVPPDERNNLQSLRSRDIERINDEIRKKINNAGRNLHEKDIRLLAERVSRQQEANAAQNAGDWKWVYEQARNFTEDKKFELAETLYQRHIETAKGMATVAQAYIGLITLRINSMRNVPQALAACKEFAATHYSNDPSVARQAANAIYGGASSFPDKDRAALLAEAEALLRRALANSPKRGEMSALCKFELANVLYLESRFDEAAPLYRDSVVETGEPSTKELRSMRQVDTLKKLNRIDEARDILKLLVQSPRPDISRRAQQELAQLEAATPKLK
ncbi:MAG: PEGA domain-containing protein [Planctomycetota bacterium]